MCYTGFKPGKKAQYDHPWQNVGIRVTTQSILRRLLGRFPHRSKTIAPHTIQLFSHQPSSETNMVLHLTIPPDNSPRFRIPHTSLEFLVVFWSIDHFVALCAYYQPSQQIFLTDPDTDLILWLYFMLTTHEFARVNVPLITHWHACMI